MDAKPQLKVMKIILQLVLAPIILLVGFYVTNGCHNRLEWEEFYP
jgi:hypothetical protein